MKNPELELLIYDVLYCYSYPTECELLEMYMKTHSWNKFKARCLNDITSHKKSKGDIERKIVMGRINSAKQTRNDKVKATTENTTPDNST